MAPRIRLNWFIPDRARANGPLVSALRGALRILGPGWAASPIRKLIQLTALAVFAAMLFYFCRPVNEGAWPTRDTIPVEVFLRLDPLAGFTAALASRTADWNLLWPAGLLVVCLFIPRGFCGYICPLGTLTDIFDWAIGRRAKRLHLKGRRWWVYLRYYLLAGIMLAAAGGVLLSGLFAAIPLITRGLVHAFGAMVGQEYGLAGIQPPVGLAHYLSIAFLAVVLALCLLGRRFWCRCVCPTGALLSLANLLRLTSRRVSDGCVECGRCRKACHFDTVAADFSTRALDCTFCQNCGGVCPAGVIDFSFRWSTSNFTAAAAPDDMASPSRRGFLIAAGATAAVVLSVKTVWGAAIGSDKPILPVRPPGSVPEEAFLAKCVRCGQCMKACPSGVLQPMAFGQGLEGLWTPYLAADYAGCYKDCNNCGKVCPTGAIRSLVLKEKRAAHIARAIINEKTCLPHAGKAECEFCVQACPYAALEYIRLHIEVDEEGMPDPDTGFNAPALIEHKCVGCGICQAACFGANVRGKKRRLDNSAIVVTAGAGLEDRISTGSYIALRQAEQAKRDSNTHDVQFMP